MLDCDFGRVFSGVSTGFPALMSKINQSNDSECPH